MEASIELLSTAIVLHQRLLARELSHAFITSWEGVEGRDDMRSLNAEPQSLRSAITTGDVQETNRMILTGLELLCAAVRNES
jgi:hypothetical protein